MNTYPTWWQISDRKIYIEIVFHRGSTGADANACGCQNGDCTFHIDTFSDWDDANWCDRVAHTIDDKHVRTDHIYAASNANDTDSCAHLKHFVHDSYDRTNDKSAKGMWKKDEKTIKNLSKKGVFALQLLSRGSQQHEVFFQIDFLVSTMPENAIRKKNSQRAYSQNILRTPNNLRESRIWTELDPSS